MSALTEETYRRIDRLSDGGTLREFEEWFVPATWDVDPFSDPAAAALAEDVALVLAEYSSEHWSEAEARALLADSIKTRYFSWVAPTRRPIVETRPRTGTAARVVAVYA